MTSEQENCVEPEITQEATLEARILELENALKEKDQGHLLLLAEMENTRKRMQREKVEMNRFAVENVISDFIAPLDQLETALSYADNMSDEVRNWAVGFGMIRDQFKSILEQHNIFPFTSIGQIFDPLKHEAVESEESDKHPAGFITKEFMKGYKSGDRVIRVAQVKITKKPAAEESPIEESPEWEPS